MYIAHKKLLFESRALSDEFWSEYKCTYSKERKHRWSM